jgi:Family of unknown function (DUF6262)
MTSTSITASERRADALRRAAQAKRQAAIARADTAIRQLTKDSKEINFRSVARAAGVSLDFLYANDALRQRIEKLRTQQSARPARQPAAATEDHNDIVHILTIKLRQERDARRATVSDLETQLAAAHGELLRLRRLLHEHGVSIG